MKSAIYRYIFLKIQSGEWNLSKRIPSEHQLAVKFSATRSLVRKILANLCAFQLLDNVTFPGYFVNRNYKDGLLKGVANPQVASVKHEWLMKSPFRKRDVEIFQSISKEKDFFGHNFAKVLRVTYYNKQKEVLYVLDTMLNHDLIKIFRSEFLDLKTFELFAENGQPVVDQEQVVVQMGDVKDIFAGYTLKQEHYLTSYMSHFNFDKDLLALSRLVLFDPKAIIQTSRLSLSA
ncbi:GntR family transcriptional regulator [[Mycoplasma] testudinis]|uniref:GntR family transcriptional regulator n=1 Tax=[Mycoplasma] testudinis TaxID=33924 RepID=UPI000483C098|nr:GntR family transcriptional regulator [[Mycoplasma] testudinis]